MELTFSPTMLRVEEVSYEDESRIGLHLQNMQKVLASMKDDSHNVISVIHSTPEKTSAVSSWKFFRSPNAQDDISRN